ncbi:hypothetical protein JHK85_057035 [Glycine max]|nr:hypothetical protein JHK85_057035 [Glycine max]
MDEVLEVLRRSESPKDIDEPGHVEEVKVHGKLQDGREVAVKRLYENNYRRVEQFMNEIKILMNLRHTNLVSLYGSTSRHSRELLLVYEYISNGTVANLAIRKIQKSALAELVNPSLGYDSNSDVKRQITSVAELAFQCLQRDRELRPSMDEVLEVLRRIGSQKDDLEEVKVYGEGPLSPSLPDHDQIGPSSIKVQKFEMQRFATIVYFTDHHLRNLLQSDSCEIFSYNITLPPSSPLGYFTINNNITLFKCNRTLQVNTPKTFLKNTSCGYDIFMGPPHSDDVSQGSLAACSMVQLPMNGFAVSANPFAFLTAEISVQFLPSDECMECHHYRGHCHLDSQRKVNCAQRYISNS